MVCSEVDVLKIGLHLANLQRLVHGIRERWRQQGELAGLNEGELGKLAADLGLMESNLNRLVSRAPNAADFLHRQLAVLGVTRTDVDRTSTGAGTRYGTHVRLLQPQAALRARSRRSTRRFRMAGLLSKCRSPWISRQQPPLKSSETIGQP